MTTATRPNGVRSLRRWIHNDDIAYDPWGTAMAWMFAVCRVLHEIDDSLIPDEWQYRRSPVDHESIEAMAGDPDSEDDQNLEYPDGEVALMVVSDELGADGLLYWGRVLHRYLAICKLNNRDY
jgi:hypothetical protein